MKELEVVNFCPFGNECESIKDDKIHRCVFFVELLGKNPQSEEQINEWKCSISWLPILLCENAQFSKNTKDSIDEFKNELSIFGDNFIKLGIASIKKNKKELKNNDEIE